MKEKKRKGDVRIHKVGEYKTQFEGYQLQCKNDFELTLRLRWTKHCWNRWHKNKEGRNIHFYTAMWSRNNNSLEVESVKRDALFCLCHSELFLLSSQFDFSRSIKEYLFKIRMHMIMWTKYSYLRIFQTPTGKKLFLIKR